MKQETAREIFDSIHEAILLNGFSDIGSQFIKTKDNFYEKREDILDSDTALQDLFRMSENGNSIRALKILIRGTQDDFRQTKGLNKKIKESFSKIIEFDSSFLEIGINNEDGKFEQKISIDTILEKSNLKSLDNLLTFIMEEGIHKEDSLDDTKFLNDLNKRIDEL